MMKKLTLILLALVALTSPARAILYEVKGPVDALNYGGTYTLNGVEYKIYADCYVVDLNNGYPASISVMKFVAFVKSLSGVTTEECVIPASFEHKNIAFTVGRIDINGICDYKYVWTTDPNFVEPDAGGKPARQVSPTVEVWGFSSQFGSSYGYETNSNIKTLRFEGDIRKGAYAVYTYDNERTVAYIQESPSTRYDYFYKKMSLVEAQYDFTEIYKPDLPNLEKLYIRTLPGYEAPSFSKFTKLTDVYFTSATAYPDTTKVYGVGNATAHLTNTAFAAYLPGNPNSYFFNFKKVLPESFNINLTVENGALARISGQDYKAGEYNLTMDVVDNSPSFLTFDAIGARSWVNGKEVTADMEYAGTPFGDMEGYEYTFPVVYPTMYVRCTADEKIIQFADPVVEALCVAEWDMNADGKLSTWEASNLTSLGEVFKGNTEIQSFDELQYFTSLTSVGNNAFDGCTGLKHVTLSDNIKTLGQYAFRSCALTEIDLPDGLTSFASYTFAGCKNLETIDIPSGVTILPMQCFVECTGLKHIYIPKTCVRLSQFPLGGCTGLSSIVVEEGNPMLSSPKGCNALVLNDTLLMVGCKNSSIPEGIKAIYNYAFFDMAELTSIELPSTLTAISQRAFQNCMGLTSVVSHIREPFTFGTGAFGNISPSCVLTVPAGTRQAYIDKGWTEAVFKGGIVEETDMADIIQFTDSVAEAICLTHWDANHDGYLTRAEAALVTTLCDSTGTSYFHLNKQLKAFPELQYFTGLTAIEKSAFSGSNSLADIVIPPTVTRIASNAFLNCDLRSIVLPQDLVTIENYGFYGNKNLTEVILPEGLDTLMSLVFSDTGLKHIYLPASLRSFYADALTNTPNLISITVDPGNEKYDSRENSQCVLRKSDGYLVAGCKNSVIPRSTKYIVNSAFRGRGLTSVEIPDSVTGIGSWAFLSNPDLERMVMRSKTPFAFPPTMFGPNESGYPTNCTLHVPHGTRQAYIDKGWTETIFKGGIVELEDETNYDVNGDGQVSIADVTKLVNKILGKE